MRPPAARVPQSWFLPRGRQVHKMRGGLSALPEKVDVVLDAACKSSFAEVASKLNTGGTYITLLPSLALLTGIAAALFSTKSCRMVMVKPVSERLAEIMQWLAAGDLSSPVSATYPLEGIVDALGYFASGAASGKIVIDMSR